MGVAGLVVALLGLGQLAGDLPAGRPVAVSAFASLGPAVAVMGVVTLVGAVALVRWVPQVDPVARRIPADPAAAPNAAPAADPAVAPTADRRADPV